MSGTFQLYSVTGSRNLATKKLADEKDRSVLAGTLPATARFMSMIVVHAIDSFVQSFGKSHIIRMKFLNDSGIDHWRSARDGQ